jgi:hypothetical protein
MCMLCMCMYVYVQVLDEKNIFKMKSKERKGKGKKQIRCIMQTYIKQNLDTWTNSQQRLNLLQNSHWMYIPVHTYIHTYISYHIYVYVCISSMHMHIHVHGRKNKKHFKPPGECQKLINTIILSTYNSHLYTGP